MENSRDCQSGKHKLDHWWSRPDKRRRKMGFSPIK